MVKGLLLAVRTKAGPGGEPSATPPQASVERAGADVGVPIRTATISNDFSRPRGSSQESCFSEFQKVPVERPGRISRKRYRQQKKKVPLETGRGHSGHMTDELNIPAVPEVVVVPTAAERLEAAKKAAVGKTPRLRKPVVIKEKKTPLTHAQHQAKYAKKQRDSKLEESLTYDTTIEPPKLDAKRILEQRGIEPGRVLDVIYDQLLKAAEMNGLSANKFLFQNGIAKTLQSYEQKSPQLLETIAAEPVIGELSNRAELYALWDASYSWREDAISFEEFLRLRRVCKTDAYELGMMLGKDFEECQKNWSAFLPRFNPDGLQPNYTQKQMRQWLDAQSETKDYLLLASRNSMKSSFSLIWLLTLHLCCPDARALLVSETTKLSAGFIRSYRSYWEVKPRNETILQKLFPEYCITPGEGSTLEFESPMAHLDLIQASATSTSMQSVVAGGRAEALLFDDPISNLSCATEEQCEKSVGLFDLLQKLREVSGSFSITIGTPWRAILDLYAVMMKRNSEDFLRPLAIRIDPFVTVKREARFKLTPTKLTSLTEEDIETYLLPVRMPWKFVKKEIAANPTFAMSQNLIIWPKESDADTRVTFEEKDLRARLKPIGSFESAFSKTVMSLDRAFSISKYADFSCITVGRVQVRDNRAVCVIVDCKMDRLRESEIVDACVREIDRHRPQAFVLEKDKGHEALIKAIQHKLMLRDIPAPQFIAKAIPGGGQNINAKAKRVKILELPLLDGRLWFASGDHIDAVFGQFIAYDGVTKSNSVRKDDAPDGISLLYETFMPVDVRDVPESKDETAKRAEEEEQQRAAEAEQRRQMHAAMFSGAGYTPPTPQVPDAPQEKPQDPRRALLNKIFGGNGLRA
jgi:hypothetical protein